MSPNASFRGRRRPEPAGWNLDELPEPMPIALRSEVVGQDSLF